MKKPYLKKLVTFNGIDVFYVDGNWIRKNIDIEFANYGDDDNSKFIPKNELWIDLEHGKKEWKYFLKFFLEKKKLISEGKSYKTAVNLANAAEQKEREKSNIIRTLKKIKNKKEIYNKIHKKLLKKYNNKVKVWIVNGFLVRSLFFLDFTEGGHDFVYKFVPKNEVWIDDALSKNEIKYVLFHELHERNLMKNGWDYEKAHKNSSKLEFFYMHNPKKINAALKKEMTN